MGFTRTAYAGPETGVRDRASYVLEQGDDPVRRHDGAARGSRGHAPPGDATATASATIALTVPDATQAYRQAVQRGARGGDRAEVGRGRVRRASSSPRSRPTATRPHVRRPRRLRWTVQARLHVGLVERPRDAGVGLTNIDHVVGNVELGRMDHWVEFYERVLRDDEHPPLRRRPDPDGVLGAHVQGDDGRRRARSSSRSTSRPRASARARSTSTSSSTAARASQHIALATDDIVDTVERADSERGIVFLDTPDSYYDDVADRVGEIDEDVRRPPAAADPRRPRRGRLPAADLHEDGAGPARPCSSR